MRSSIKQFTKSAVFAGLLASIGLGSVDARPSRVSQIPNGSSLGCASCHVDASGGGPRNSFGQAIEGGFLSGGAVTWNAQLAGLDSDGDGVNNGAELGDPDGDGTPAAGVTVTNPGDATSFNVQQPADDTPSSPDVAEGDVLMQVGDVVLEPDVVHSTLEAGSNSFSIVFGVPIDGEIRDGDLVSRNLNVRIRPGAIADDQIEDLEISEDSRTLTLTIDVPEDTFFEIVLGRYPGNPDNRELSYIVGTTTPPTGSISGLVTVGEGIDPIVGGRVTLFTADAIDVIGGDDDISEFVVSRSPLAEDLSYLLRFVADGDYILLARGLRKGEPLVRDVSEGEGPAPPRIRAFYDADGDGVPEIIQVADGEAVTEVDIEFALPPAPEPQRIVSFVLGDQEIAEDAASAAVSAGPQEGAITFSRSVQRPDGEIAIDFDLFPDLFEDVDPDITLNDDGTVMTTVLDLPESSTFQLAFGPRRLGGERRQNFYFGTQELSSATVSGSLLLPEGVADLPERTVGLVLLVPAEASAEVREDLTAGDDEVAASKITTLTQADADGGGELMELEPELRGNRARRHAVRVAVPDADLNFSLGFVPDGSYLVAASLNLVGPNGEPRQLVGFHDPENTGAPAVVEVSGGSVEGLTLMLGAPAPPPPRVHLGEVLTGLLDRLESGEIEALDIAEILSGLNEDDRRRLRQIAGEDGLLTLEELRRVLGGPAPEESPVVAGRVSEIDTDNRTMTVRDVDENDWLVTVTEQTRFEISGDQNVLGGPPQGPPATKQGRPDQPGGGNGGQGGGTGNGGGPGPDDGKGNDKGKGQGPQQGKARTGNLNDLALGVQVEVFGEMDSEFSVRATRVLVLGGGVVRNSFSVEGMVAFFDPFSLRIELGNGQVIEVTRNTALVGLDGEAREASDLIPGTRVQITGSEATKGRRTTLIAETIQVLGGRPFRVQGVVESVVDRVLTLLPRTPEPIDPRARFGDARGRRVDLEGFQSLLAEAQGLQVLAKFNRFGSGVVSLQIYDPRQKKPIKDDERLFNASRISVVESDSGLELVFDAPPVIDVPEDVEIRGDTDAQADLTSLVDKKVVVDGEAAEGVLTARAILVVRDIGQVEIVVEVGDLDGEGSENDARITVVDGNGDEIPNTLAVALDNRRPEEALSGDVQYNLRPGKHKVEVRIPELPGVKAKQDFIIRDRGPGLQVTETFPADGDVGVPESVELSVTFDAPIQEAGRFVNVVAFLRPGPESGRLKDVELSDDGQTVFVPVELSAETTYTLQIVSAVSESRSALRRPVNITFSTGGSVETPGSVAGSVGLLARAKQVDGVEVLSGEVIAVNESGDQAGRGAVETDGSFEIAGLTAGTYQLFATLETSDGSTSGFLDDNGDGQPDDVSVSSGQTVAGIYIGVLQPIVLTETVVEEVTVSPVTLDLDTATGDQALTFVAGEPGGEIDVAVYLTGAADLLAFDLLLEFDPTALTFVEVLEDAADESEINLMKQGGGFALGITSPGANSVNWSVAILGPTDDQLGQGDGLLGIFRFAVNESFFGATDISIAQLVQESSSGATVIQPFVTAQVDGEGVTSQLVVSSGDESISASGGQTTILVELTDLDGLVFSDDSETEITFTIESGDATVDSESSTVQTVSAGLASVTLEAQGSGTIGVRVTTSGASSVLVEVGAPGLGEGEVGPLALDTDTTAGDQGERVLAGEFSSGDVVTIDVAALSGVDGQVGFQVTLAYDPVALSFTDFAGADLMAAAVPITNQISDGVIELNAAILGDQASGDSGSIGSVTFTVLDGFSGQSQVELTSGSFGETLDIGFGGSIVQIGGSAAGGGGGTPDFDGDGQVGFTDFVLFAGVFGTTPASTNWDPNFDLDDDGTVGFTDFVVFATAFGTSVKPALTKPVGLVPETAGQINLATLPGSVEDEVVVAVTASEVEAVSGFDFVVDYDAASLELTSVSSMSESRFVADGVALMQETGSTVRVADIMVDPTNGEFARLTFRVIGSAGNTVDISQVAISGPDGDVSWIAGARMADLRPVPAEFALQQNFPNPFNPETQIAFQVPESGVLSLVVYNTLGQQVRVLEDGPVDAGFHRTVWDGRDAFGRQVSSGLYLVRMASGQFSAVKKMLMLK